MTIYFTLSTEEAYVISSEEATITLSSEEWSGEAAITLSSEESSSEEWSGEAAITLNSEESSGEAAIRMSSRTRTRTQPPRSCTKQRPTNTVS